MNRKLIWGIALALVIIGFYWIVTSSGNKDDAALITNVEKGKFEVTVTTTGELQAKNSEKIMGPSGLRKAGIYRVKISDIIPEGTKVEKGDYIATLDRSEVSEKIKEVKNQLEETQSKYEQVKLDTALTLREKRKNLEDLRIAKEERKIELKQAQFEPEAIQRQNQIELDKAKRNYQLAKKNYKVEQQKAKAQVQEVSAKLAQKRNEFEELKELLEQFKIKAPEEGMLIYEKSRGGNKKEEGSSISAWNPVVATLPDMSTFVSETYVNEVDISKVNKGQPVNLKVDAFPDLELRGKVIEVANVGETIPDKDAKVFQVSIELTKSDSLLRPAMTTSNEIITKELKDVLYIPLECLHNDGSTTYVFKEKTLGITRQEVKTGIRNDNHVVIKEGLNKNDKIYLSIPEEGEEVKLETLPIKQ